ncbi:MAG: hypothetical protein ABJC26_13575 [Gemmatimonadaceae bacterium]
MHSISALRFPLLLATLATSVGLAAHGSASTPSDTPSDARRVSPVSALTRCAVAIDSVASTWRSENQWRRLAPYPVPREATPTDSVGVWLERWTMDDGSVEMRRVTVLRTDVAKIDANRCEMTEAIHNRTYNADAMKNAFTDAALDSLIHRNDRGMVYVWSPGMPLSVKGLTEAKATAAKLGIAFTAIVAEAAANDIAATIAKVDTRDMQSLELVYRNATIHYPSVLFYANHKIVDGVIPGYRNRDTYTTFAKEWFDPSHDTPIAEPQNSPVTPAFWVDHKAIVTNISAIPTVRRIGFFFKPIAGTNLISYTSIQQDAAYFFDIKTGMEQRIPGHVDPVPTPDGRFITLPGLKFHRVADLVAGNGAALFTDADLPDEYQTTSLIGETKMTLHYRVITGWRDGARFRDYDVTLDKAGKPESIKALNKPFVPCGNRHLTLPIIAKSGYEFGAFDPAAKSDFVLELNDKLECVDKLSMGFATGKIAFSYDGVSIAFATARINTDAQGPLMLPSESFYKDALVLNRKTGRIVSLSANKPLRGMTFPEFQKNGTIMLLDQIAPGRLVEVIRVVSVK